MKNYNPLKNNFVLANKSKELKKIFPNRAKSKLQRLELYYKPKGCYFHLVERTNIFGLIVLTLLLPFGLLFNLQDSKETFKYYLRTLNELNTGSYSCDLIHIGDKKWLDSYKLYKDIKGKI